MLRKEMVTTLIGLTIFGALTGLLLEVMMEGDEAKFRQLTQKIKDNTMILFETAQMAAVQDMISHATVGFELSTTQVDPDSTPNNGDEYFLNQVSECVFSSPDDIPFPTCLICQLSDQKCMPKVMCPVCEKPILFTVRYDNPTHPDDVVRIEVYKNLGDFGDTSKLLAEFDGVMDGDEITIDGRDFGKKDTVESNTAYRVIFENQDETGASIHTSCSQDLFVGDVHLGDFGVSFTVVSGTDADLNPTVHDPSCEESMNSGVSVLVEGKKILDDGYVAGTIETISLPTGPEHPENDVQDFHCVVLLVCGKEPPQYRTQTQGGWGQNCSGNNNGCYRDDNFDDAFPDGLIVGDTGGFTAEFTQSSAVQDLLPTGGSPAAFDQDYVDPLSTSAGVFAGQVIALSLNVGFDMCSLAEICDTFAPGESTTPLADLIVVDNTSACFGMTVGDILVQANLAISGQPSIPSLSNLNNCATNVNENYVDGDTDNGFLAEP